MKIRVKNVSIVQTSKVVAILYAVFAGITNLFLPIIYLFFGYIRTAIFQADHSFVFLIRENVTGSILFLGGVVNPAHRAV